MIVDDHHLFRLGVSTYLKQQRNDSIEIVGEAADGETAIVEIMRKIPDVVLLDINLAGTNGVEIARHVRQKLPGTRILALTAVEENEVIVEMIRFGVSGYLIKDSANSELIVAIEAIAKGNTYFSKTASDALVTSLSAKPSESNPPENKGKKLELTKREIEILRLVAEEKSNLEIAQLLYVSPRTVETHKRNILLKLKIKNVAGLVKYYIKNYA